MADMSDKCRINYNNERQIKAVLFAKENGKITNSDYQELNEVSKSTATRDLSDLVNKTTFELQGSGKRDIHYVLLNHKNLK